MHHHERTAAAGAFEDFEQLTVVQHQVVVGHENLERAVAVLDQRRQFLPEHARRRVRDDEVEPVIRQALAVGLFVILHDAGPQTGAARLQRERQDGRVAAGDCGAGAGQEIVRHFRAAEGRLREMHMAVDAAGHHDEAGGVDLARRSLDALGNGGDAALPHADVGAEGVARGGDGAAADGEIKVRHDDLRRRSGPTRRIPRAVAFNFFACHGISTRPA